MKLYTSDWSVYEGMDEETVIRLRAELGKETQFITEEAYLHQQELERTNAPMKIF
jgi:hypothetical protein